MAAKEKCWNCGKPGVPITLFDFETGRYKCTKCEIGWAGAKLTKAIKEREEKVRRREK
jgi:hypothetical protein